MHRDVVFLLRERLCRHEGPQGDCPNFASAAWTYVQLTASSPESQACLRQEHPGPCRARLVVLACAVGHGLARLIQMSEDYEMASGNPDSGRIPSEQASMRRRSALTSLFMPALLASCAGLDRDEKPRAGASHPDGAFEPKLGAFIMNPDGTRSFRNHALRDQDGRTVRFQDDLMAGQIFAATFFYVHCTGICADMTRNMAAAYDYLQPIMGKPLRFYSFSLAEDSPADLKEYMQARGIYGRPGWTFLTAPREVIKDIRWGFGFYDPDEEVDNNLNGHTGMVRFGNQRLDKWSSCPALGNPMGTARAALAVFPPNQRPHIAALDRTDSPRARPIPGYRPPEESGTPSY
ncbi:MAG: hypothetical protein RLZZ116_2175 [Planctomycetota bacterium]